MKDAIATSKLARGSRLVAGTMSRRLETRRDVTGLSTGTNHVRVAIDALTKAHPKLV